VANKNKITEIEIDDCWNRIGVQGNGDRSCAELQHVVHCRNCDKFVSAGRQLLDRESSIDYQKDWGVQISEVSVEQKKQQSVVIFRLGDQWFGLPPKHFHEVIKWNVIHSIPHNMSEQLRGIVAIRGELQLCISLGHVLGVDRGETPGENIKKGVYERMVVLSGADEKYVFPVSEIRDIFHYSTSELSEPPATAAINSHNVVFGVLKWKDKYISCLDFDVLNKLINGIFE